MLHCSLSQVDSIPNSSGYPKVKIIGTDTVFLFTHNQVKDFEKTYVKLDLCNELSESYTREIALSNEELKVCDEQLSVEKIKFNIAIEKNDEVKSQNEILASENKKQGKRIKLLKKTRTLFTIGGTLLGGGIGYLITKISTK